ncbi:MAG: hypothetical protein KJZ84_12550 [Bryobacteraceae bacterium]|nr:hypothetical protein [Bryobacteraceae bacterium]
MSLTLGPAYDESKAEVSRVSAIPHDDGTPGMPAGGSASGSAFRYEPPGSAITFYLSYDVIDRLGAEVMRGFGLVPRRGAEVGGILLGAAEEGDRPVVRIDDFVPVPCEHLRGPSYLLSESDLAQMDEQLAKYAPSPEKRLHVVGYYRGNTRDQVQLGAEDLELLDSRFTSPTAVCLLVRPYATRVSEAALLFRGEDGKFLTDEIENLFPFRRRELGGGRPPRRREAADGVDAIEAGAGAEAEVSDPETVSAVAAQLGGPAAPTFGGLAPAPAAAEAQEPEKETQAGRGWVWIPLSFIFLLLGVVLGFQISISFREPAPAGVAREDPFVLGLSVEPTGESLTLRWNVDAPAIRQAEMAILTISEASNEKTVELGPEDLRRGGVLYRNVTPDVRFHLEAILNDRSSVTETARTRVVEPDRGP